MNEYSDQMDKDVPDLSRAYKEGIEAYIASLQVLADFSTNREELVGVLHSVQNVRAKILELADAADSVVEVITRWPRITKDINRAKRRT